MILGESLWPGMTRSGFGHKAHIDVTSTERVMAMEDGHWQSPLKVVERDFLAARELVTDSNYFKRSLMAAAIKSIEINDQGCYISSRITPEDHTKTLWQIAEYDMGGAVLNEEASKAVLRICGVEECLNARHYDFTHKLKNRPTLLTPNHNYFVVEEDGVIPLWEVDAKEPFVLPTVEESAASLRELQLRCPPYVDDPRTAPLTANGISKITLDPVTGCWMVRSYYSRPDDFGKSFMYDGYGRLGFGPALKAAGYPKRGNHMAHRVVWIATGHKFEPDSVLNHECGFHPCCNPAHISQVSVTENILHGRRMNAAQRGEVIK